MVGLKFIPLLRDYIKKPNTTLIWGLFRSLTEMFCTLQHTLRLISHSAGGSLFLDSPSSSSTIRFDDTVETGSCSRSAALHSLHAYRQRTTLLSTRPYILMTSHRRGYTGRFFIPALGTKYCSARLVREMLTHRSSGRTCRAFWHAVLEEQHDLLHVRHMSDTTMWSRLGDDRVQLLFTVKTNCKGTAENSKQFIQKYKSRFNLSALWAKCYGSRGHLSLV